MIMNVNDINECKALLSEIENILQSKSSYKLRKKELLPKVRCLKNILNRQCSVNQISSNMPLMSFEGLIRVIIKNAQEQKPLNKRYIYTGKADTPKELNKEIEKLLGCDTLTKKKLVNDVNTLISKNKEIDITCYNGTEQHTIK